jgi:hypothetical protein
VTLKKIKNVSHETIKHLPPDAEVDALSNVIFGKKNY